MISLRSNKHKSTYNKKNDIIVLIIVIWHYFIIFITFSFIFIVSKDDNRFCGAVTLWKNYNNTSSLWFYQTLHYRLARQHYTHAHTLSLSHTHTHTKYNQHKANSKYIFTYTHKPYYIIKQYNKQSQSKLTPSSRVSPRRLLGSFLCGNLSPLTWNTLLSLSKQYTWPSFNTNIMYLQTYIHCFT